MTGQEKSSEVLGRASSAGGTRGTESEPRPKYSTPEMNLSAARRTANDLAEDDLIQANEIEDCAKDIAKCARPYIDGYDLAKRLENSGWDCNFRMAEILDGFSSELEHEIDQAEKAWAERVRPVAPYDIGQRVKLNTGETGKITGIYEYRPAKFVVLIDGEAQRPPLHESRRVVNFEDTTLISP